MQGWCGQGGVLPGGQRASSRSSMCPRRSSTSSSSRQAGRLGGKGDKEASRAHTAEGRRARRRESLGHGQGQGQGAGRGEQQKRGAEAGGGADRQLQLPEQRHRCAHMILYGGPSMSVLRLSAALSHTTAAAPKGHAISSVLVVLSLPTRSDL